MGSTQGEYTGRRWYPHFLTVVCTSVCAYGVDPAVVCMYRPGMYFSPYTREGATVHRNMYVYVCVIMCVCVSYSMYVTGMYTCAVLRYFTIYNDTLSCSHVNTCNDNDMILFTSL